MAKDKDGISLHSDKIPHRMEWKIDKNVKDKYIEVITNGIANKEDSLNMAKSISHSMKAHRIKKALIDP